MTFPPDPLSVEDNEFLAELTALVRDFPEAFREDGKYLDSHYSVSALRRKRAEWLTQLRASKRIKAGPYRRTMRASFEFGREDCDRRLLRFGEALKEELGRLDDSMTLPQARTAVLLGWLLFDRAAQEFRPVLSEFQAIPWDPIIGEAPYPGRAWLEVWRSPSHIGTLRKARMIVAPVLISLKEVTPLTNTEMAILELLAELPPTQALNGGELISALPSRGVQGVEQSTLTGRILPSLRKKGWAVENMPSAGYYLPARERERFIKATRA